MSDDEATEKRRCIVCGRRELTAVELQTCITCQGAARQVLLDIESLSGMLAVELIGRAGTGSSIIGGSRGGDDRMPGGDVLVLTSNGTNGMNTWTENREHVQDEVVDGLSVVAVLATWEDDWRAQRGLHGAQHQATITSASAFLLDNLGWAAQHHSAFDEFADELAALRGRLRSTLRDGDVYEAAAIACPDCGSELARTAWDPSQCKHDGPHCDHSRPDPSQWPCHGSNTCGCDQGGRRDWWTCRNRSCGRRVEAAEYWLAVHQKMQEREAAT